MEIVVLLFYQLSCFNPRVWTLGAGKGITIGFPSHSRKINSQFKHHIIRFCEILKLPETVVQFHLIS